MVKKKATTLLSRFPVLVAGACLSALGTGMAAHAADLRNILGQKEVWSGVYEGELDWTHQPRLVTQTDRIPGRLGIHFGTYFTLQTEPADAGGIVLLRYKTIFPAPGMRDPRTGQLVREVDGMTDCLVGKPCLAGYGLDTPEEIIPGEWRFIVSFRGKELLSKTFIVQPAL